MSQKQPLNKIHWSLAATLPPLPGALSHPGVAGAVCGTTNNSMIIAGGANFPGGLPWTGAVKTYHSDIYLFEKNNGAIKAPAAACPQKLPENIAYSGVVSTPAGIVYAGGENEKGISDKVYRLRYDGAAGGISIQALPSLPLPLTNLSAAYYDNKLFVAGGESAGGPSRKFMCLDVSLTGASWQSLPDIPIALTHAVLVAQSDGDHDCLYLAGGRQKNANGISTIYANTYCYDLKKRQWSAKQSLPYPLSAASGIARGANYILLLGGDNGEVFSAVEAITLQINATAGAPERDSLIKQKNELLSAHPGFNKDILLYNTMTGTWVSIGQYPYAPPATTTALNWGEDIIIPSGEIRAGIRTPQIIKGEVVFPVAKAQKSVPVFVSGTEGYKSFRIPAILRLPNGDLLAFAEGRVNGAGDYGNVDIVLKRSSDGGASWSALSVVAENDTMQAGNPAPVLDLLDPAYPKGRLFLFYNPGDAHERDIKEGKGTRQVCYKTSADGGHTWSAPVNISTQVHRLLQPRLNPEWNFTEDWRWYANTPGHAFQIPEGQYKGRLYIAANHTAPMPTAKGWDYDAHGFYTDDHGKTFRLSNTMNVPGTNEATAAPLSGNRVMINMRNQSGGRRSRVVGFSSDGGASWDTVYFDAQLPDPACEGSLLTIGKKKGKAVLAFANEAAVSRRDSLTLRISFDEGLTWPQTYLIDADPTKKMNTAYSDIVLLKKNTIGILYEKDNYKTILFTTVKIKQ